MKNDLLETMMEEAYTELEGNHQSDIELEIIERHIEGILDDDELIIELLSRGFGVFLGRKIAKTRRAEEERAEIALITALREKHDELGHCTSSHSRSDIYKTCIRREEVRRSPTDEEDLRITAEFYERVDKIVEDYAYAKLKQLMFADAQGNMRYLIDFRVADIRTWTLRSSSRANSWLARENFFERALQYMQENEAETIGALPSECIEELNDLAAKVWS